jgi:hypothetical protein
VSAELLGALWNDYVASTPQAQRIHALLSARGEAIRNDHIALRTYDVAGVDMRALAAPFEARGWVEQSDRYIFTDKHLKARYWRHPDAALPKVFISEMVLAEMSPTVQSSVAALVAQLPQGFGSRTDLPWAGRPWTIAHGQYEALLVESEYAAWVAAFGFRVNHFTVDVGRLTTFPDLASLCAFLIDNGFRMNEAGGLLKGTQADRLVQASTRADSIDVAFSDTTVRIPSCYYEFAKRYPLPSGELFQGFIPSSADKIFESTDARS